MKPAEAIAKAVEGLQSNQPLVNVVTLSEDVLIWIILLALFSGCLIGSIFARGRMKDETFTTLRRTTERRR
jgi:hypothetical protein